jgi:hypothetical protein
MKTQPSRRSVLVCVFIVLLSYFILQEYRESAHSNQALIEALNLSTLPEGCSIAGLSIRHEPSYFLEAEVRLTIGSLPQLLSGRDFRSFGFVFPKDKTIDTDSIDGFEPLVVSTAWKWPDGGDGIFPSCSVYLDDSQTRALIRFFGPRGEPPR